MSTPKITYWFGAGASANAVPMQRELANAITSMVYEMKNYIRPSAESKYKNEERKGNLDALLGFTKDFLDLLESAGQFGTVDILARKLWLTNQIEAYAKLRFGVALFFIYHKNFGRVNADFELIPTNLDNRYTSLLAILLDKTTEGKIKLTDGCNFLSYNYDLQLEGAFCEMLDLKQDGQYLYENLDNEIAFSRANGFSKNRIVHLNGHSGLIYDEAGRSSLSFVNEHVSMASKFFDQVDEYLRTKKEGFVGSDIFYAWEMDVDKLRRCNDIIAQTDELIIVGYSFPAFNRKIDLDIMSNIKKGCQVTLQDKKPQMEALNSILPTGVKKAISVTETDQFVVPPELFGKRKDNRGYNDPEAILF